LILGGARRELRPDY